MSLGRSSSNTSQIVLSGCSGWECALAQAMHLSMSQSFSSSSLLTRKRGVKKRRQIERAGGGGRRDQAPRGRSYRPWGAGNRGRRGGRAARRTRNSPRRVPDLQHRPEGLFYQWRRIPSIGFAALGCGFRSTPMIQVYLGRTCPGNARSRGRRMAGPRMSSATSRARLSRPVSPGPTSGEDARQLARMGDGLGDFRRKAFLIWPRSGRSSAPPRSAFSLARRRQ